VCLKTLNPIPSMVFPAEHGFETHHLAIDSEHIIMHLHFRPRICLEDWCMAFPFLSGSPITEDPRDVCRMMWLGIMQRSGPPCKNKPTLGGISNKCILDQLSLQITHQGLPKSWLWLNMAQPCGQDGPLYQVVLFHLKSARTHWLLASATPFKQTQHAILK
jgi:hypothetical protein